MSRICPKCNTRIVKIETDEFKGKEYTCIFCGYIIYEKELQDELRRT